MKSFFILLLFPLHSFAQPAHTTSKAITGLWQGYVSTAQKKLPYELVIGEKDGKFTVYSLTSFIVNGDEIISLKKMHLYFKNQRIIIEDEDLLFDNFTAEAPKKIKQINTLFLNEEEKQLKLTGTFETKTSRTLRPANGEVYLEKKDNPAVTKLMAKLDELKLTGSLSFSPVALKQDIPALPATATVLKNIPDTTVKKDIASITSLPVIKKPDSPLLNITTEVLVKPATQNELAKNEGINKKNKDEEITAITPLPVLKPLDRKDEKRIILKKTTAGVPLIVHTKPAGKINIPAIPANKTANVLIAKQPVVFKPIVAVKPAIAPAIAKKNLPAAAKIIAFAKPAPVNISVAPAPDLAKRKIETIEQLFIASDSLQFSLYDNGEVDGDTVSIILNGKTIVSRQGLSTTAFTKTVYITPDLGDTIQLIMYAENLGALAPNTGLLVLQYDNKRQEIRFSGDLNKNAAITLRRKEKK